MRLDMFLPFLRKPKKGTEPKPDTLLVRIAKQILPAALFSDRATAKPGLVRQWLKRLGPSWLSAPVRRVVQTVFFLLFLFLFFYVAWPYSARPAQVWPGLAPAAPAEDRTIAITAQPGALVGIRPSQRYFVSSADPATGKLALLGPVTVREVQSESLVLAAEPDFPAEKLEELQFDPGGPWTLSETDPDAWPSHYADSLASKEVLHAESLLVIDPLVAISTAIAGRTWVWSLVSAIGILVVAILVPRGFCGYLCPLGTLIDLFDWGIGKRVKRFRVAEDGWWVHIKYYLLAGTLLCSVFGVLVSGYFAAIPVITRGMLFLFEPLQTAASRGWHNVPAPSAGHFLSLAMFAVVLGLGFLRPRFWCKYVCPSGAVFSISNLFRVTERKVESSCIHCNKCVQICPFDAIKPDFTTRTTDCTLCQTCAGVCPTEAIKFVERWNLIQLKVENDPPTHETALGRRGFLSLAAGSAATIVGATSLTIATKVLGADLTSDPQLLPIRPPGSVPEPQFLDLCIRCGECFKACPNNVLQPLGFEQGLEGLWTPAAKPDWAGCESSCNACGQVCPTGAIRAIPLEEKRVARMGLAIVDLQTCLPHAGKEACQLCVDDCIAAGYHAIEFVRVGTQVDAQGEPIESSGFLAPSVVADKCVGCGLCQTRCYAINVAEKKLLSESAIVVQAGEGREDRLMQGSYLALREAEQAAKRKQSPATESGGYLPDFLQN